MVKEICSGTHKGIKQNVGGNKTMKYHRAVLKLQETDRQMPNVSLDSLGFSVLAWTLQKCYQANIQRPACHIVGPWPVYFTNLHMVS